MSVSSDAIDSRIRRLRQALLDGRSLNSGDTAGDVAACLDELEHTRDSLALCRMERASLWDAASHTLAVIDLAPRNANTADDARTKRGALDVAAWCAIAMIWIAAGVIIARALGWR